MSLTDYEFVKVQPGYNYELGRGVIVVSEIPFPVHLAQVITIRQQLYAYEFAHPARKFYAIAAVCECKLLVPAWESERHPDVAIYKTTPPGWDDFVWRSWVPELVAEVVSAESRLRDYQEKPEEYLALGVREYWIFDADRREMLTFRRVRDRWVKRIVRSPQIYRTRLFPGLVFACDPVCDAADAAGGA
jgi:Uma2 family endonuclease